MKRPFLLVLASLLILGSPLHTLAETKILTAEATYTMGDGETPSFAEAMALQKAKQTALEEAGTYVESYTKVQNLDLTMEEIQTIAGGVLEVQVLEKKRTLVGDGLQFYVRIKTTVTTDKMQELAQRVKGKNVGEEYKKLKEDFARLNSELDRWKELIAKTPTGPEREAAVDQIREREKAFAAAQKNETAFYQRLVSGEALFAKALGQLAKKQNEKAIVDGLVEKIIREGFLITLGEPDIHAALKDPQKAEISVPVSITLSRSIKVAIEETSQTLGGTTKNVIYEPGLFRRQQSRGVAARFGNDVETILHSQSRFGSLVFVIELALGSSSLHRCYQAPELDMDGIDGYLGHLPIVPAGHVDGNRVQSLGISHRFSLPKRLRDEDGFVVMFDEPTMFTVVTDIPIEHAKQIKSINGKLVQGTKDSLLGLRTEMVGLAECRIER